jgi:hypothetical protein
MTCGCPAAPSAFVGSGCVPSSPPPASSAALDTIDAVALAALPLGSAAEESDARRCSSCGVSDSSGTTCRTRALQLTLGHMSECMSNMYMYIDRYIYRYIYLYIDIYT